MSLLARPFASSFRTFTTISSLPPPRVFQKNRSVSSKVVIEKEHKFGAHNYHPLPVVFNRAEGINVWDPEGKKYFDFLSAYSAVNQGHCHPKIVEALVSQAKNCTLSSRAFFNDQFPSFAEYVTSFFGYEMVLPMNTGAEAVETAIKLARRWGYVKKGIPHNKAQILSCCGCFHGRTNTIISLSCDPDCTRDFGPHMPGFLKVDFNDLSALEKIVRENASTLAGFLLEPIQGEAGVIVPDEGYLQKAKAICEKYNVLFMADEVQTGIARTGKLLAVDHENVKPDILILGKALSGGTYPISAVLSSKDIMLTIRPGEHGSTFGGNPLASAVGIAALKVVKDEDLANRAETLGQKLRSELSRIDSKIVKVVRGKGLLNAIVIDQSALPDRSAWDLCLLFKERGLLAKPTHHNIIRLTPPLVMKENELQECLEIISSSLRDFPNMPRDRIPGVEPFKVPKSVSCERCGRDLH